MKLGVSYNIFDGEELLEFSSRSIRTCVDYIAVVYQELSNFGNPANPGLVDLLRSLKERNLIDDYVKYDPNLKLQPNANELAKRNIGLEMCRKNNCSHFLSIDCDECYKVKELNHAKNVVESGSFDSSACQMQTYYKTSEWALDPPEQYFVPLIYKLDDRKFVLSRPWPVAADPTRKLEPRKMIIFTRDEIEMHHYSFVRKDIMPKLINSSAGINYKDRMSFIGDYWKSWVPGTRALLTGKEDRYFNVVHRENTFGINI